MIAVYFVVVAVTSLSLFSLLSTLLFSPPLPCPPFPLLSSSLLSVNFYTHMCLQESAQIISL